MKINATFLTCACALALAGSALGQTPAFSPEISPTPESTPPPAASVAPTIAAPPPAAAAPPVAAAPVAATPALTPQVAATPAVAPTASLDDEEDFDRAIERKIRKHFTVDIDGGNHVSEDVPWIAVPIVLIIFLTIFGLPVAIVGTILYFSFSKSRAMHKTVRMMVEKGQPVPEALLNPPPVIRQRSDLRRGVVLLMIGTGLIVFFGAVNDWEGGIWSLGLIPFLIGLGYLLVWRLDVHREDTSPRV